MVNHFLTIADYSSEKLHELLYQAIELKKLYKDGGRDLCAAGKTIAIFFEKPSCRTRVSFETLANQLGAATIYLKPEDVGSLGQREPIKDLMRVMNGMVDMFVGRVFKHSDLVELAKWATIPVVNALCDKYHPCQGMADIMTAYEHLGDLKGKKLTYIGDGNNVSASLAWACFKFGMTFCVARPDGYDMPAELYQQLKSQGATDENIIVTTDPKASVENADVIYTDTWVSMGQEEEKAKRIKDFQGYQVNMDLVKLANDNVKVMHCLPAYRDLEITDEVIESPYSVIFDEAENRLHFQRMLVKDLLQR
ncbi:MAG: ornithine carbamoyltransferase [Phycisphaerae bacterium]|nr:ornithine carbamoyltransferase [Phycisphaerae bacterium]